VSDGSSACVLLVGGALVRQHRRVVGLLVPPGMLGVFLGVLGVGTGVWGSGGGLGHTVGS